MTAMVTHLELYLCLVLVIHGCKIKSLYMWLFVNVAVFVTLISDPFLIVECAWALDLYYTESKYQGGDLKTF